jgi:hypothetical protein
LLPRFFGAFDQVALSHSSASSSNHHN